MEDEHQKPRRFRFHVRTLLIVIAFLALLMVDGLLWVRLKSTQVAYAREHARLNAMENQSARDRDALSSIIRTQRDMLEGFSRRSIATTQR